MSTKRKKVLQPSMSNIDDHKLYPLPLSLTNWIRDNKHDLKPPVSNKLIYGPDTELQIQIVGGPNTRTDFHFELGEEFFYQIQGDMILRIVDGGKFRDVVIREGEVFLLPGRIPHSPQRYPNTIGLVIERKRREDELDGLIWYCSNCNRVLVHDQFPCKDLGTELKVKIENYYSDVNLRTCKACLHVDQKHIPVGSVQEAFRDDGRMLHEDHLKGRFLFEKIFLLIQILLGCHRIDPQTYPNPFDLKNWLNQLGKLPSKQIFGEDSEFAFTAYKGEMLNKEFSASPSETWFYQIEGSLELTVSDRKFTLNHGESYVLPAHLSYTATRDDTSVGLVMVIRK
jgi:3-hydroxyanthranilate 3,4-dioxygenase